MQFNIASDYAGTLQALNTAYKTLLAGWAQTASLRRGKLVQFTIGPVSDPGAADCNIIYRIQRQTADGTATSVTPNYFEALEAGTPPSPGSAWKANYTAEGTYANPLWGIPLNQHSGFCWYAPDELGIPWPAVNLSGLALMAKGASATYTGTAQWGTRFQE